MVENVAWNHYVLFYFWVFDGRECCLESVCIILLLTVCWYRMLSGFSMYYFTFDCLMVENVAWNQYVLFYFWVFDGTECCLESVCIIVLLTVYWYRMLPGISMFYCTFDCLLVQNVAWNQYVLFYFWLITVWWYRMLPEISMYYFNFWVFDGTECCLESVCIISSPGPKVQVNYCHHLASVVCRLSSVVCRLSSVVCRLSSVNFSHFKLLLRNHMADWNRT